MGGPQRATMFTSWPQRLANAAAALLAGLLAVGVTAESPMEPAGLIVLAISAWLAGRAMRMGVWLDDQRCTVRNLTRTRRVPLSDVRGFVLRPTAGTLFHNDSTVLERASGRDVPITVLTLPIPEFLQGRGMRRLTELNVELRLRASPQALKPRDANGRTSDSWSEPG